MATLIVDYDCGRRCTVEYDLADVHARHTHNQMLLRVDQAHAAAHKVEPPRRTFRYDHDVLVKAGAS
jgi:hypothetical protein